ncbi:transcriptional regulator Spx, arsenate reductase-like protein [Candidatus Phytoplasma solani]|uniref:transcriptional regulator Spx n=1 Tax=Candidatus Phytoplasma solani TaxID=69896 RepID=UPI0032DACECA
MVVIYTSFSCSSSRKAKKWLTQHRVQFIKYNLFSNRFHQKDLDLILKNCINGFDDIISKRSKIFKEGNIELENMNTTLMKSMIMENRGILKSPIIIEDQKIQIGYNEEGIRIFLPKKIRDYFLQNNITFCKDNKKYEVLLQNFFKFNK